MKKTTILQWLAAIACAIALTTFLRAPAEAGQQHVVLAGGCFWGMEGVFESLKGVSDVVSGYAGGSKLTAHYEVVSTGMTGHD